MFVQGTRWVIPFKLKMCQGITDPILIFQALQIRGGEQEGRQSPRRPPPSQKKGFFVNVPFFSKSPWNALFERSNQKFTWKLIFYTSKLK